MSLGITFDDLLSIKDNLKMLANTLANLKRLEEDILIENDKDRQNIEDEIGVSSKEQKGEKQ